MKILIDRGNYRIEATGDPSKPFLFAVTGESLDNYMIDTNRQWLTRSGIRRDIESILKEHDTQV
jgi:hypothetical protein